MNWITILGFAAAVLTTISFFPQLIKTIKTKQTKDISIGMYILITIGILLWLVYGLLRTDYPVIIANAAAFIITFTIFIFKIIYK